VPSAHQEFQIIAMRSIFLPLKASLFACIIQGCATGPDQYNLATATGKSAFHERHTQIAENRFYIEELGNGFSNHENMEVLFKLKADQLCTSGVASLKISRGTRYPDGKLPDVVMEGCYSGGLCNARHARFPLVFGFAECHPTSNTSN
jgi:hypothetical protein